MATDIALARIDTARKQARLLWSPAITVEGLRDLLGAHRWDGQSPPSVVLMLRYVAKGRWLAHWRAMLEALRAKDFDRLVRLDDLTSQVRQTLDSGQHAVTFEHGALYYFGSVLDGQELLLQRILRLSAEGIDFQPLLNFITKLQCNVSYRVREQLYQFLERSRLPITPDGCFLAYKRVSNNYLDLHTSMINNAVGQVVSMDRFQVDDDPSRPCSAGLHVCSLDYLKEFHGERLVACKVDPVDVVCVPLDDNFTKMRVCRYEVVEELPISLVGGTRDYWDTSVVSDDPEEEEDDWEDEDAAVAERHDDLFCDDEVLI